AAPYATELQRKKFKGPVHYKRDADAEALKAWQRKKIAENRY
ncbi:7927_t:CDS:1, partial [Rhizophagus irregularis]